MFGRQGLFKGTLTLGAFRGLSQVLGFVQFAYFLNVYGSSIRVDALFIAQTVPFLLTHLFGNPVTLLLVPVYLHLSRKDGDEEAWRFISSLIVVSMAALCLLTVGMILLAPFIVSVLAPGFGTDDRLLAVGLLQWMSVLIVINGLAGPIRCLYFAHQTYVIPAVSTICPTLGIIAGIFFLHARLGISAYIVGGIVGSSVQLLLMWSLVNLGERRFRFRFVLWHHALKEFFSLLAPRFLVLGLAYVNGAVDRIFASGLGASSISALGYALTITEAPTSWMRTTFGGTIVPVLSTDAANDDFDSFKRRIQRYLGLTAYLMTPCSVLLLVLAKPLVQTMFQRGNFDAGDSQLMSVAAFYYAMGLVPFGMGGVLVAGYLSMKDTVTPFKVSCCIVFLNVGLNFALIGWLGLGGLALATSLVATLRLFVFLVLMKRRLGAFTLQQTYQSLAKMALSGAIMAIVLLAVGHSLQIFAPPSGSFLRQALPLGLTCVLGASTYLLVSWMVGVPIAQQMSSRVYRTLAGRLSGG